MRLDLAMNLKIGDVVFNAFGEQLIIEYGDIWNSKIISPKIAEADIREKGIIFNTIDTRFCSTKYMFDDIYLEDLYGESDEEKSFVNWVRDNKVEDNTCFFIMKQAYKQGYAMGFSYKYQYSYEEQIQK